MVGAFATVYTFATIPSIFLIERENEDNAKGAAVVFPFITFFAFTLLPLLWIYPPEINPLSTRTLIASTCANWICNFALVLFTPLVADHSPRSVDLFFALFKFIGLIFGVFFYVETAGRQLGEVDRIYAKAHIEGKMAWRVAQDMPKLNFEEIVQQFRGLGLDTNELAAHEKIELGLNSNSGQELEEVREK
ncbi:MFS sugar transporter Stl1, putative [Penicillium digitatum]|nr:hypothetical protein PDIDSM_1262 [Penicillium digitatum]QQK48385.1 MFS sugar transporter Stl1, putative [Penicillium digitatum]